MIYKQKIFSVNALDNNIAINLLTLPIIFLYIFAPRIDFLGGLNLAYVSLIIVFLWAKVVGCRFVLQKTIVYFGFFLLGLSIYHFALASWYGNNPAYFINICSSVFSYLVFAWFLSSAVVKSGITLSSLMDKLILLSALAVFLNSVIIIAEFLYPEFRAFVESFLVANASESLNYAEHISQFRGFSAAGGAGLSVVNAIGILLFIYLALNARFSHTIAIFCSLIIVIATIFSGRTGLIAGLFFVTVFIGIILIKKISLGPYGVVKAVFLVLAISSLYLYLYELDIDPEIVHWAFEWVEGLSSLQLDTKSSNELKTQLFLPDNISHLLFGFGFFEGQNSLYLRSDSGYLKTFFSIGVILGAILYIYIAVLFYTLYKISKNYRWLFLTILVSMFIVEIKEPFLYQNFAARIIFLLTGAAIFVVTKRRASVRL